MPVNVRKSHGSRLPPHGGRTEREIRAVCGLRRLSQAKCKLCLSEYSELLYTAVSHRIEVEDHHAGTRCY